MEKRIVVTGGSGFLGKHVVSALQGKGNRIFIPRSKGYDLRNTRDVKSLYANVRPNTVIHLAAVCGGIGANQKEPGRFFYDNMKMGIEMIEHARLYDVEKFVQVGTVCAYPKFTPVPFKEEELWNGYPEETNAPYGIAKKALLVQCQAYRQQYGLNAIYLLPVNLYGPGDNFDLNSSHVIPALIRKCMEAKQARRDSIEIWGTGSASREFLYVEDCAKAIVAATDKYNEGYPINIGSGNEIKMKDLIVLIARLTGFEGRIVYDPSKPDGQPRRCLDVTKAIEAFGFRASTSLEEGIRKTIKWYVENTDSSIQL